MTPWRLLRWWRASDTQLLPAVRACFTYDGRTPDRATGWLWLPAGPPVTPWLPEFTRLGPQLLAALERDLGVRFTAAAFQAYRDGAGQDWHHDRGWGAQAILSLGVTRTFGVRRGQSEVFFPLAHGDLLFMPPGFQDEWEHCVPVEDVPGERVSLVFRTPLEE